MRSQAIEMDERDRLYSRISNRRLREMDSLRESRIDPGDSLRLTLERGETCICNFALPRLISTCFEAARVSRLILCLAARQAMRRISRSRSSRGGENVKIQLAQAWNGESHPLPWLACRPIEPCGVPKWYKQLGERLVKPKRKRRQNL